MTATSPRTERHMPVPPRTVRTRRIGFNYPEQSLDRHYVQGDLVMSHVVSMLSAMFPEGEDFFVNSVKHYRDRITDPELKAQVAGFIGQEVTHGREHRVLNERLQQMGFKTRIVDRRVHYLMVRFGGRFLPPRVQLAITAALEHYTATLAERLLTSPDAQALLGQNEVRSMLLWHALEESEHKAVAFDVYRAVGGAERMRINVMRIVSVLFILATVFSTFWSMLFDRATYHPVRLVRSLAALRHSPFLAPVVVRNVRAYNKVGFHPDDFDATELLARWRAELFGTEGVLTDHLR